MRRKRRGGEKRREKDRKQPTTATIDGYCV